MQMMNRNSSGSFFQQPQTGMRYRHKSGTLFQILCRGIHSVTGEEMVVMQGLFDDYTVFVMPLSDFREQMIPEGESAVRSAFQGERAASETASGAGAWQAASREADARRGGAAPAAGMAGHTLVEEPKGLRQGGQEELEERQDVRQRIRHTVPAHKTVPVSAASRRVPESQDIQIPQQAQESDGDMQTLMAFLDTRNFDEKFMILKNLERTRGASDTVIDAMAASLDIVLEKSTPEQRLSELIHCLDTRRRYESTRLRG